MWDILIIDPLVNTLLWIYSLVGNFGIAIILFTILIRLLTHPLTVQQTKGMQAMQDFQSSKEWQDIQKKYKDDKQKLQQEQVRLYQEMGINPLGSCLPTLIQFPIIIGLYQAITRVLASTPTQLVDLSRHIYSFADFSRLIPVDNRFLWMNLGQPERLYLFGIGIPVLAVLVVITTYFQSRLMTPPSTPGNEQAQQMTQTMNIYMPILMGWMAWTLASGLAVYFVVSNLFTIVQYAMLGKLNWNNLLPGKKADSKGASVKNGSQKSGSAKNASAKK